MTVRTKNEPLNGTLLHYIRTNKGKSFDRFSPLNQYVDQIKSHGAWNYDQVLTEPMARRVKVKDICNEQEMENFSSSDYLGLSQHPEIIKAAIEAAKTYGVHASASPTLAGNTIVSKDLGAFIARILKKEVALVYTTGWAANYGAITGLANRDGSDHFLIDAQAHNCLRSAVESIKGQNFQTFKHNDCEDLEAKLRNYRLQDQENGIFIVIDSLYSMKSTLPDLGRILKLADDYEAFIILDVAHDFAALGNGLGALENIDLEQSDRLIICGSFSKSLGANGGFVAGCRAIYHQLMLFSPTYIFSTGIDPIPAAIAKRALEIAFSPEGDLLRYQLNSNCNYAKKKFAEAGLEILGNVSSAIIPVLIGHEKIARIATQYLLEHGILVNRAEFPAVPRRQAIFRFSMMASHEIEQIDKAARILKAALEFAKTKIETDREFA